ncbi:hypothetical protein QTI66_32275 [Variovorax sp. J22R133]|uniref:hypothetical protein n=1 Tax=Variovorax brevis TaxID=3053503 RepID=UPI0025763C79|nr:hypothetical protein [Variovorax sp. J22R133]MDM0116810.1 hypothetical protein [Variovorax sp. J22R133]
MVASPVGLRASRLTGELEQIAADIAAQMVKEAMPDRAVKCNKDAIVAISQNSMKSAT